MIGIFLDQHIGDQPFARQAARNNVFGGQSLRNPVTARPAAQLGPYRHQHAVLRRDYVEPLGPVFGDNILATLPSTIGNTVEIAVENSIARSNDPTPPPQTEPDPNAITVSQGALYQSKARVLAKWDDSALADPQASADMAQLNQDIAAKINADMTNLLAQPMPGLVLASGGGADAQPGDIVVTARQKAGGYSPHILASSTVWYKPKSAQGRAVVIVRQASPQSNMSYAGQRDKLKKLADNLNSASELLFYGGYAGLTVSGLGLFFAPEAAPAEFEGIQASRGAVIVSNALGLAASVVSALDGNGGSLGRHEINAAIFSALKIKGIDLGTFTEPLVEKALDKAEESEGIR